MESPILIFMVTPNPFLTPSLYFFICGGNSTSSSLSSLSLDKHSLAESLRFSAFLGLYEELSLRLALLRLFFRVLCVLRDDDEFNGDDKNDDDDAESSEERRCCADGVVDDDLADGEIIPCTVTPSSEKSSER